MSTGKLIVFSAPSGSGKTTLIRILASFIQPTSGAYFINEDTYLKIDFKQFRAHIGYVTHGETPFDGTMLENLTFNDTTISHEKIKWAVDAVQLSDCVRSLTKGLDTRIVPEGKQLSSSDAQKIVLARNIINQPKILFLEDLDEYLYHIDRMMMNLKRNGCLESLKGIVVGSMTKMKDNDIPWGKNALQIIEDVTKAYNIPVVYHFPAGHIPDNRALIFGRQVTLEVTESGTKLIFE